MTPLPTHLRTQLDAFRRRLFIQETLQALAVVVGAAGAAWVVLFVLDRFFETGMAVRLVLLACGATLAGLGLGRWLRHWVLSPRDDRRLSLLIQKKYRKLGDTLLGAIELAEGRVQDDALSQELRVAAIGSVAQQAAQFNFLRAVNWRRTGRVAAGALACTGVLVAVGVYCLPALGITWWRLANPFASEQRRTFTRFAPLEDPRVVARGEPFEVRPALDPGSEWKPETIAYRAGALQPGSVHTGSPIAMPGLAEPTRLDLWAGDGRQSVRIDPQDRPTLGGLLAKIALPEYLQLPPLEEKCGNSLAVVVGSKVAFNGAASRALAHLGAKAGGAALTPVLAGSHFSLPAVTVDKDMRLNLEWADTLKLGGAAPHEVQIRAKADQAPEASCPQLSLAVGILPDEVLRIPVEGGDDFGLKELSVHFRHVLAKAPKEILGDRSVAVTAGKPDQAKLEGIYTFSPRVLGIPEGSLVDFQAGANDYFPSRATSYSEIHRIQILTLAQHAQLIQDQMAQLANKMEELASAEQQLKEETQAQAKQPDAKLGDPKSAKQLAEQEAREKENAKAMRQLSDELAEIARQAQRNKDMPKDLMAQMEEVGKNLAQASEQNSPAASAALGQAQGKSKPGERREEMEKAAKEQQKAVDALRQAAKKLDQVQRKLDAESFVNRLTKESEAQNARVELAKRLLPQLVGQKAADLNAAQKAELAELVDGQTAAMKSLHEIEKDLLASYTRMHNEPYREVTEAMDKEKAFPRNQEVIALSGDNNLFMVMEKGRPLAALYAAWAEKLKDKEKGGGGGGKQGSQIPPEVLAALMRMIEQEQDLRWETRSVGDQAAQRGETSPGADTKAAAGLLSGMQDEVLRDLVLLARRYQNPPENERAVDVLDPGAFGEYATLIDGKRPLPGKLLNLMGAAAHAMDDGKNLLASGQAGAPTIAAETEAIELLAKIFAEGSGKPGKPGPPQPGMMQKMMAKMMKGAGSGNQPGHGQQGNGTAHGQGKGVHQGGEAAKSGDPAGGDAGGLVPPEFQADIEAYHQQMDKLEGGNL